MVKERRDKSEDDRKTKKESDLKKFLKKRSFLYLMCAVVFVVFFVPDMIAPSDLENKLVENLVDERDVRAWNIVKSYRGPDDSGYNLIEAIITQTENAYPNEQILKHNDTVLEVSAGPAGSPQNIYEYYMVTFTFQTYDAHREYVWMVDMKDQTIFGALNDDTQKMMDIVELYD